MKAYRFEKGEAKNLAGPMEGDGGCEAVGEGCAGVVFAETCVGFVEGVWWNGTGVCLGAECLD